MCTWTLTSVAIHTMCDFYNFGLIFVGQMHCLPQWLKSTLFEISSNGECPKSTRSVEKISNNIDFSLWGNRATTWEYFLTFSSETKIMKIRYSGYAMEENEFTSSQSKTLNIFFLKWKKNPLKQKLCVKPLIFNFFSWKVAT